MKKILSLLAVILFAAIGAYSQTPAPGIFNYQGVARNSVGNVLVNKSIALRLTVHDGASGGPVVYQETRGVVTNPFGLFNAQVGSAGATNVTGTIAGVNWGVGNKYIQVEIDPNGGTTFINIGTAQIASVPYALYASLANDLVLPFIKTQSAPATTLIGITNSATTGTLGALNGTSASLDANASAVIGTISSTGPGGFSSGVRGINNGTGGLGIGVYGSQNGSGWGVYGTTPSGIGVNGSSTSGIGVNGSSTSGTGVFGTSSTSNAGRFEITNAANNTDALVANTNGGAASWAIRATSTGAQGAGIFTYNNAAGTAVGIRVTNNGSGAAVSATTTGTGSAGLFSNTNAANAAATVSSTTNGTGNAGLFSNTNAANNASTVSITTNGTSATALSLSGPGIWGSAMGITNTTSGMEWRTSVNNTTYTVTKVPGATFSPLQLFSAGGMDFSNSAGTSIMRLLDNGNVGVGNAAPITRLHVSQAAPGAVTIQDGTQGVGRLFFDNGAGVGTGVWVTPAAAGFVTGSGTLNFVPKWTPSGTNLGNSLLFDDGNSVALGTITPTHRFTVNHSGSTGIGINSTAGFSVVDINAASGDAAIRFANAGVNQWNIRNRPGDNYLEIFELGGGGSRMVIQDATGNVGIGQTVAPAYKLDVLHGGSTGLRVQSSASFSVVDIDAQSGDAALRFVKAGVNQWNIRNRPADDYLEIFELGGGGSRMVIQDGTGWVGIGGPGAVAAPAYQLDVEHGGATGIRSKSNASFSVVDIDAFSGDAALRFQKAGVGQWNTRNRPADDYYEIFELGGGGSRFVIQNATGWVGIGGPGAVAAPAYQLDVEHGGATGIRSKSNASFSVVDIDAASGDAALRFQKAGVGQWNTRNRPADDYYEIFELGGGGSRVVIQDGTGNVGIGATVSPAYKLDVEHGGTTGIRVLSTASFSVVDIDGASGDAALRFIKAGVNKWNTRNEPIFDDYQWFELGGGGERMRIKRGTGFVGINTPTPSTQLEVVGTITGTVKAFTIDHPLDPANKTLRHISIESPEALDVYSGNIVTDASGKAVVNLPAYFEALNIDYRYQLTVIGAFAQAIISKEIVNNKFEIATNQPNVKVSWQVQGVRNDPYMKNTFDLKMEEDKPASIKGKYYHPESYGLPQSMGVNSASETKGSSTENVQISPAKQAQTEVIKGSSLENIKVAPSANKVADKSGSVEDIKLPKVENKPADNSGSVAPQTETKKTEAKSAEVKGTSVEDGPIKPTPVEKKKVTVAESTKTD